VLRQAVADLSFLYSRGYAEKSASKLVGDRYGLNVRQRRALIAAACSDSSRDRRRERRVHAANLHGSSLSIDGYNLLITAESILSNGILLRGRDAVVRDLASVHGSYHKVEETLPAIRLIGETLECLRVACAAWYLDAPVSNSGKLKGILHEEAVRAQWDWRVELVRNPDPVLAESDEIVASSDSYILDRAARWVNLTDALLDRLESPPPVIDLRPDSADAFST
jgi:hypothetical protein